MDKKSFHPRFINILIVIVICLLLNAPILAQQRISQKSFGDLYRDFETAQQLPCGQRSEAVRIGRTIIEDLIMIIALR